MKYPITNFAKGLVDKSSEAKLTDDYRQKCSILSNFYVNKNKNLQKRPPLKTSTVIPEGTIDFIQLEEGLVVLRKPKIEGTNIDGQTPHITLQKYFQNITLRSFTSDQLPAAFSAFKRGIYYQKNLHILDIYNNENAIVNSYLFWVFEDTARGLFGAVATEGVESVRNRINQVTSGFKGDNAEYYFHSIKNIVNSTYSQATNRTGENVDNKQLTIEEAIPRIDNAKPTQLIGIFQNWTSENIISHTARTKPINLGASDDEEALRYWNGEIQTLFVNKSLCNDYDTIKNNKYSLVKSRSDNSIELTFAGMRYRLLNGKLTNVHSDLSLMPSIDQIKDSGSLIDSGRKMHKITDFPIKVLEVDLTNSLPRYTGTNGVDAAEGTGRDLLWAPSGLSIIGKILADTSRVQRYSVEGLGALQPDAGTLSSEVKLHNSISEYINTNKEMKPLLKFLQPTITDYVPFDYASVDAQSSGSKSSTPAIRNLVPDIKITKNNTDYPTLKKDELVLTEQARSSGLTSLDITYGGLENTRNLSSGVKLTETTLSNFLFSYEEDTRFVEGHKTKYNVFWTNTRSMNLDVLSGNLQEDNLEAFNSPGIVLHIQTGNREDESGNPVFNPYGNLTQGLGGTSFVQQNNWGLRGFSEAKTVKTLFLTYDYGSKEIRDYFKDTQALSSVSNLGTGIESVTLVKDSSGGVEKSNTYINDLVKNLTFYKLYPSVDLTVRDQVSLDGSFIQSPLTHAASRIGFVLMPVTLPSNFITYCTQFAVDPQKIPQNNNYDPNLRPDINSRDALATGLGDTFSLIVADNTAHYYAGFYLRYLAVRFGFVTGQRWNYSGNRDLSETRFIRNLSRRLYGSNVLGGYITNDSRYPRWSRPFVMRPVSLKALSTSPDGKIEVYHSPTFPQVTFQEFFIEPTKDLIRRNAGIKENVLSLSGTDAVLRPELRDRYSSPIANYLTAFSNTNPLNAKVFEDSEISPLEQNLTSNDPSRFSFISKLGFKENIVDVIAETITTVFLGLSNSIKHFTGGLVDLDRGFDTLTGAGTTSNVDFESRFIIYASDKNIHQTKYYEEAGGWIANTINSEFQDIGDIDRIVNLYDAHRLFFFYKTGEKTLYCLTMGENRGILGFSRLDLGIKINLIKVLSKDELQIISDNRLYTMDFRAGKDELYEDGEDIIKEGETVVTSRSLGAWESRMATLPVFVLTDTESSLFEAMSVVRAVISCEGYAEFDVELLNEDGSLRVGRSYRESPNNDIAQVKYQSGAILIDGIPNNSGKPPRFSIVNNNNKYLSIASAVLDLGKTKGKYAK